MGSSLSLLVFVQTVLITDCFEHVQPDSALFLLEVSGLQRDSLTLDFTSAGTALAQIVVVVPGERLKLFMT